MANRFALKYDGTMIAMFDDDNQIGGEFELKTITSQDEFEKWGQSDSRYCRFVNEETDTDEVYVKIANRDENYEAMTLTEANEEMADPDSQYYTGLAAFTETEIVHVTSIRSGSDVWGHETSHCDEGGCAAGANVYYKTVDASEVKVGHVYEIDENGKVLAEIEE